MVIVLLLLPFNGHFTKWTWICRFLSGPSPPPKEQLPVRTAPGHNGLKIKQFFVCLPTTRPPLVVAHIMCMHIIPTWLLCVQYVINLKISGVDRSSRHVSEFESEFECCRNPTVLGKSEIWWIYRLIYVGFGLTICRSAANSFTCFHVLPQWLDQRVG